MISHQYIIPMHTLICSYPTCMARGVCCRCWGEKKGAKSQDLGNCACCKYMH